MQNGFACPSELINPALHSSRAPGFYVQALSLCKSILASNITHMDMASVY